MAALLVAPDSVRDTVGWLERVNAAIRMASTVAATPTTAMAASADDEISTTIAALFISYGQQYQELSAQALACGGQFVDLLNSSLRRYIEAETNNALMANAAIRGNLTRVESQFSESVDTFTTNLSNIITSTNVKSVAEQPAEVLYTVLRTAAESWELALSNAAPTQRSFLLTSLQIF